MMKNRLYSAIASRHITYPKGGVCAVVLGLMILAGGCAKKSTYNAPFAKGADVGWLSEMERDSVKFYNAEGEEDDCLRVLQQIGCEAIRLRVWVVIPSST